jgi:LuxR family maltose regulon positive regulatory protein
LAKRIVGLVVLAFGAGALVSAASFELAQDVFLARAQLQLPAGDPGAALSELVSFHAEEDEPFMPFAPCLALGVEAVARAAAGRRGRPSPAPALPRAGGTTRLRGSAAAAGVFDPPAVAPGDSGGTAHRSLADELLTALDQGSTSNGLAGSPLLEPLSERELAVLRFLPTMLSNPEIVSELFVSPTPSRRT